MTGVKFCATTSTIPDILDGKTPKEFLQLAYNNQFSLGIENLKKTGHFKLLGWAFNFNEYLKVFVYKQYDAWHEIKAPNKTQLRQVISGKIQKIIEVK